MAITVNATFEDGMFKLSQPVELPEGAKVWLASTPENAGSKAMSEKEQSALIARGREWGRRARERNRDVSEIVIRREIEQAIETVRRRQEV